MIKKKHSFVPNKSLPQILPIPKITLICFAISCTTLEDAVNCPCNFGTKSSWSRPKTRCHIQQEFQLLKCGQHNTPPNSSSKSKYLTSEQTYCGF
jgi:hypothetical protein